MKQIVLDGSTMKDRQHLYHALTAALGSPNWHGENINAFIDSMVYGGIDQVQPPYEIVVTNTGARRKVREAVEELSSALQEGRQHRRAHWGDDVEVSIRLG